MIVICLYRPEDYKLVDAGNEVEADKENIIMKELDIAGI